MQNINNPLQLSDPLGGQYGDSPTTSQSGSPTAAPVAPPDPTGASNPPPFLPSVLQPGNQGKAPDFSPMPGETAPSLPPPLGPAPGTPPTGVDYSIQSDPLKSITVDPSPAPPAPSPTPTTTPTPNPTTTATDPNNPASVIDALYKQYNITDGGRGSGFADRAYWLEHPSEILNGRLAKDLAGTGPDQPTGTPGSGPWSNSGKSSGGGGTTTTTSNNTSLANAMTNLGGSLPGGSYGTTAANQDPFSQMIAGGYGSMIGSGGAGIAPLNEALQRAYLQLLSGDPSAAGGTAALEGARGTFEGAKKGMLSSAEADLANRGLISQPGATQGPEVTSEDLITRDLAPAFDASMGTFLTNAYGQATGLAENNNANMLGALGGASSYQEQMANIALNTLHENNSVAEFAANYGLSVDALLYEIANNQDTALANLLATYLANANTAAGGHV